MEYDDQHPQHYFQEEGDHTGTSEQQQHGKRSKRQRSRRNHFQEGGSNTKDDSTTDEEITNQGPNDDDERREELDSNDNDGHDEIDDADDDDDDTSVILKEVRRRQYSLSELVSCLHNHNLEDDEATTLPPELYRRVMDYRLAQRKRWQKYHGGGVGGLPPPPSGLLANSSSSPSSSHSGMVPFFATWGIYGVYKHLSNVRTDLEWAEDAAWRRAHGQPYLSWGDFDTASSRRSRRQLYFTYTLMALCTLLLVVEYAVNDWSVEPMNVNPLIGPSADTLVRLGALDTLKIVEDGQWFRLVTPVLLHAGLLHYLLNMGAIYFFTGALEQEHGWSNALWLFLIPAIGGNVLSALFLPQYISVGASGGIFGCIGACLADITVHWNLICLQEYQGSSSSMNGSPTAAAARTQSLQSNSNGFSQQRKKFWALFWIVLEVAVNVVIGLTPYVDNFIHLGGLVYGVLCGWTVIEYAALNFLGFQATLWMKLRMFTLRFIGLFATFLLIVISTIWLATSLQQEPLQDDPLGSTTSSSSMKNPCPNCRYFNCIPFPSQRNPWWHCDDCSTDVSAQLYKTETRSTGDGTDADEDVLTSYYTSLDLTCPNGEVISRINVTDQYITDKLVLVRALPDYCRDYCSDVYAN